MKSPITKFDAPDCNFDDHITALCDYKEPEQTKKERIVDGFDYTPRDEWGGWKTDSTLSVTLNDPNLRPELYIDYENNVIYQINLPETKKSNKKLVWNDYAVGKSWPEL